VSQLCCVLLGSARGGHFSKGLAGYNIGHFQQFLKKYLQCILAAKILTVDFVVCALSVGEKKIGQVSTCWIRPFPCEFHCQFEAMFCCQSKAVPLCEAMLHCQFEALSEHTNWTVWEVMHQLTILQDQAADILRSVLAEAMHEDITQALQDC
jgi:hypothetical protein